MEYANLNPQLTLDLLAIIVAYILGVIGFVYVLPKWTSTPGSLYWH